MNITALKNVVTSKVGLKVLTLKTHSPTLLFGAGVVGFAGTVVLASRATLRLPEVLDESLELQSKIVEARAVQPERYSEKDMDHDLLVAKVQTVGKIAKLYGPALLVGGLSVAALTGSHHILSNRNAALSAAYAGINKAFNEYRKRVVADQGSEKDREYRYGSVEHDVLIETEDQGPQVVKKKSADRRSLSMYATEFSRATTPCWQPGPGYNQTFLLHAQAQANDRLKARGWLVLNDVLEQLGIDKTKEGMVVGWSMADGKGDGYVDFGVFEHGNPQMTDYFRAEDGVIILDFNVDGNIFDRTFRKEAK